ncbi:MAG TPA: hypothetical protein VGK75_13335 [Casimicrobiaceae bacterium]
MRKTDLFIVAASGLLIALGASLETARAQALPSASDATAKVYGGTREYRWTFYVPVMTLARREIVVQAPEVTLRSRGWDYEAPDLREERRKVGQVAEFDCKYVDWWRLPNECGVRWRDVYADLPVLTVRRHHVDFDAAEWAWQERRIRFDVPYWTWTERTLTVLVPVLVSEETPPPAWSRATGATLARESLDDARATLVAQEAAAAKTVDDGIAALDASIASVVAEGADPGKLAAVDGTTIDLGALRRALLAQKAQELGRYARIRDELDAAAGTNGARAVAP